MTPVDCVSLGKLLREARLAKDLVLKDVAKQVGVSVPFLSDLERGQRVVGPKRLHLLAVALGVTEKTYEKLFQLRGRLPPEDERWILQHPGIWPSRRKRR